MYTPPNYLFPPAPLLTPFSPEAVGTQIAADGAAAPVSQPWGVGSGNAVLYPFGLTQAVTLQQAFWMNGAAVTSGYVDCGVYDLTGTLLISTGCVQQVGANALQAVSVTANLPAGRYYMALAGGISSVSIFRTLAGVRVAYRIASFPLPATVTFSTNNIVQPFLFGFATRTLVTS